MTKVIAPWTAEQVAALNRWQRLGYVHPFTCPNGWNLVATTAGWVCPGTCGYTQDWAHDFMADATKHLANPATLFNNGGKQ